MDNPSMSVRELAGMSRELCGQDVSYEFLKDQSAKEGWEVERNSNPKDSVVSEVNHIRQIIYQQIVSANESGLMLIGEFDYEEVTGLLDGIAGLKIVRLRPGGVDAAMVNAYMNLLSKSNVKLDIGGVSGKTAREQVLELGEQAARELDEYYRTVSPSE